MPSRSGRLATALRSPVVVLLVTGLLALAAIVAGTTSLSRQAADKEAVTDARNVTEVLAHAVAEPALPPGLVTGDAAALDRFDRLALERLSAPGLRRIKIWNADGVIVYSDKTQLIGSRYPLDPEEREVLETGTTEAEVSDLTKPENRFERRSEDLLEVYTRIDSPEGVPLLFEVYFSADAIAGRQAEIAAQFRPITLGALGTLVLVAASLLWGLTRRLRRSADERERLLLAAADASDAERVRIARDLHDGVVQDLAGATFAVAGAARHEDATPPLRATLLRAANSLRTSQRSLRSLLVEIYPPDLDTDRLPAALHDLLAPAQAHGIEASSTVSQCEDVRQESVRLVWRVAQEAVRNALRHSGATVLHVDVQGPHGADDGLRLTVTDDGVGFDTNRPAQGSGFGLRGLASLAEDRGGRLEVRSRPGAGTTVVLELRGVRR